VFNTAAANQQPRSPITPNTGRLRYGKGRRVQLRRKGCSQRALWWGTASPRSRFEHGAVSPPTCPRTLQHPSFVLPTRKNVLALIRRTFCPPSSRVMANPSGSKCCLWQNRISAD